MMKMVDQLSRIEKKMIVGRTLNVEKDHPMPVWNAQKNLNLLGVVERVLMVWIHSTEKKLIEETDPFDLLEIVVVAVEYLAETCSRQHLLHSMLVIVAVWMIEIWARRRRKQRSPNPSNHQEIETCINHSTTYMNI